MIEQNILSCKYRAIEEWDFSSPWILIENREKDVAWIKSCEKDYCALCAGCLGTELEDDKDNEVLKGEKYLKIIGRIESVNE